MFILYWIVFDFYLNCIDVVSKNHGRIIIPIGWNDDSPMLVRIIFAHLVISKGPIGPYTFYQYGDQVENSAQEREAINSIREQFEFENTYVWELIHNVILKNQVKNRSKIDNDVNNQKSKIS